MRAHVTGEIGRHDYDSLTFREVSLIIEGYSERLIHDYRNTRLIMYMMAKMWGDPKSSPRRPEDLWELPGDEKKGQLNADEMASIFEKLKNKDG